jgi:hypothetical protein
VRIAAALCVVALPLGVAACGGDDAQPSSQAIPGRPLTRQEASLLAGVLYRNYQQGMGHFQAASIAGPEGGTLTLVGDVDYRNHQGHARVYSPKAGKDKVVEVLWDRTTALEYRPGMVKAVRKVKPGAVLIARPVDRAHRRLDQMIEVITALAAPKRENPQLIRQRRQARFIRTDTLGGTPVEVLRYGPLTTVWVDPKTGRMLRFESSNKDKTAPIVVDLARTESKGIQAPPTGAVVSAAQLGDVWVKRGSTSP